MDLEIGLKSFETLMERMGFTRLDEKMDDSIELMYLWRVLFKI
jgi:hypothetical protein